MRRPFILLYAVVSLILSITWGRERSLLPLIGNNFIVDAWPLKPVVSSSFSHSIGNKNRQSGRFSRLFMSPQEEVAVLQAQEALKSPKLARRISRHRSRQIFSQSTVVQVGIPTTTSSKRGQASLSSPTTKRNKEQERQVEIGKRTNGMDLPYDSAIQVLCQYHAIHGNLVLPRRFIVPEEEGYPREWYGLDLSSTVYNMKWWQRHIKSRPERVSELTKLGFVWERLQPEWNLVLEALVVYKSLHGDVLVPNKFVVPYGNDDDWPKATWGIPLGSCVYRIRARNDFLRGPNAGNRRDQLENLGFVWDVHEHRFQLFFAALRHFARLNQCGLFSEGRPKPLRVPATFVVPSDIRWPSEVWGYPLGAKCTAVRQKELYVKGKPDRQRMLEELGFRKSGNADLGWLEVVHAAAIYSKINNHNLDVPYHFVVPAQPLNQGEGYGLNGQEWPWPEYLWGLPLGQRLKDIRVCGAYLKGDNAETRRRQLDALGFNWKPKRGRPSKSQQ